jgi:hypothetical protein
MNCVRRDMRSVRKTSGEYRAIWPFVTSTTFPGRA